MYSLYGSNTKFEFGQEAGSTKRESKRKKKKRPLAVGRVVVDIIPVSVSSSVQLSSSHSAASHSPIHTHSSGRQALPWSVPRFLGNCRPWVLRGVGASGGDASPLSKKRIGPGFATTN